VNWMRNEYQKSSALQEQEGSTSNGVKTSSCLGHVPPRREDVLEAATFGAMLALERRRAQRSRQPFVLVLLDASEIEKERRGAAFGEQLTAVVSGAIRESDIIGWYRQNEVLAVIFTEISASGECAISDVLYTKICKALRENLEFGVASKLVISVHLFPESGDRDRTHRVVDSKLYPDISGKPTKRKSSMILKRGMDIVGSMALLIILSPVLAAIAAAIKLTSKGPVIFKQDRLGQYGKSFACLKFRTMFVDNDPKIHREYVQNFIAGTVKEGEPSETESVVYKIKDDPRITPVGRMLRRMSLDELPQFWNVMHNEMSLVGPRPPLPYEFEAYDLWHRRRVLEVKPGVTGLWQVMGRSRTSFDEMVRMDLRYCQRWSLWLDLKILLATPLAVFKGSGAY